jgi:hypothetical protein
MIPYNSGGQFCLSRSLCKVVRFAWAVVRLLDENPAQASRKAEKAAFPATSPEAGWIIVFPNRTDSLPKQARQGQMLFPTLPQDRSFSN